MRNATNYDLCCWYDTANRFYFHNKLQKDMSLRFVKLPKDTLGTTYLLRSRSFNIEISKKLKSMPKIAIMTLLHEMVHVENPRWKGHGWKFNRRMLKLAKDGAFSGLW